MISPDPALAGYYDYHLVALSVLISMLAAFVAGDLAGRMTAAGATSQLSWLIGGASASAVGTWSMHCTGMLAFSLPVSVQYDWPTALLSFLPAFFGSAVAFFVAGRRRPGLLRLWAGGLFMGGGVSALHYAAMAAMRLPAVCRYAPGLVTLSVVLAIVISLASLWLIFHFGDGASSRRLRRAASVLLMGAINPVMHYTGMSAATFTPSVAAPDLPHAVSVSSLVVAGVSLVPVIVLIAVYAIYHGITARKEAELTIETLMRVSEKLNATLDVDALLESLIIHAMKLTDAEIGWSGLRTEEGMACHQAIRDFKAIPFEYTWPPNVGWPGWVLAHKVSYFTDDAQRDTVIVPEIREKFGVKSGIDTPLLDSQGEVVGFFEVNNKKSGGGFTKTDLERLMAVARVASVALQNALAYRKITKAEEDLRQLSGGLLQLQDEDRRQIARELHDTTAQDLAALTIDLTLISDSISATDSKVRNRVIDALAVVGKCVRDIRTLSYLLHPPLLDEGGLTAALKELAEGFSKRSGIQVDVDLPSELGRLPQEAETALFRIVQECLNNIRRHSRSPTARIRLARAPTEITLEVKDEGVGIPPGSLEGPEGGSARLGVGIRGMRERMRQLGGRLEIISDGHGTAVRAILPLH